MEEQIQTFSKELKALIARYRFTIAQVNQALAILSIELEEKKLKALLEGKK